MTPRFARIRPWLVRLTVRLGHWLGVRLYIRYGEPVAG